MRLLQVGQKAVVHLEEFSKRGLQFLVADAQRFMMALQAFILGLQNLMLRDEAVHSLTYASVSRARSLRYLSDGLSGRGSGLLCVVSMWYFDTT